MAIMFFRPEEDITAYEVAFILAHSVASPVHAVWDSGIHFSDEQWNDLPEGMKRHFSEEKK